MSISSLYAHLRPLESSKNRFFPRTPPEWGRGKEMKEGGEIIELVFGSPPPRKTIQVTRRLWLIIHLYINCCIYKLYQRTGWTGIITEFLITLYLFVLLCLGMYVYLFMMEFYRNYELFWTWLNFITFLLWQAMH